jgi:NADP-dependent 3-hydroxy acid dehydrogenase YdfG
MTRTAVVTGASSGIGAATARRLAAEGYALVLGARRLERLEALAAEIGDAATVRALDVTDPGSVATFCDAVPECRLLVNCAGGALGMRPTAEMLEEEWTEMFQANVLGVVRMVKALLPKLVASGDGHIVTLGSIAGFETYPGGSGYTAAKHAVRSVMDVLRLELLGQPVRVSEIAPGMVDTEFLMVRFGGDTERVDATYAGMTPLSAGDIAECISFVVGRPAHVNIDQMVIRPRDQARATVVYRRSDTAGD